MSKTNVVRRSVRSIVNEVYDDVESGEGYATYKMTTRYIKIQTT